MTNQITLCELTAADKDDWKSLWLGYLEFYKATLPNDTLESTWQRILTRSGSLRCIGARDPVTGELVGITHYLLHESAWTPKPVCYLQDLFVLPSRRGSGVGRILIDAVAEQARKLNCGKLYWLTQEGNAQARALYDKLAHLTEFVRYDFELTKAPTSR